MSINVNVTANPISVRRGKMVLSDLENIKKSDREHRRRLRLEQVQEQSKAFSKRMLERAKRIEQEELSRLQNEDSKMKRAHNNRLMEYHRRFQDIENIGYAHENAAKQPDIEMIKQAEEERNKALARARGTDAIQRVHESNKVVSPRSKQHERLHSVRDIENERSRMVAQLTKKCTVENDSIQFSENDSVSRTPSSSKKRAKCVIHKKTPVRKISKHKIRSSTTKSPSRVSVAVQREESNNIPPTSSSSMDKNKNDSSNKSCNVPTTISGPTTSSTNQESKRVQVCESDDNEPRKIVPSSSEKPEKLPKCHNNSSSTDLSSTSVSSSSVSDSSSLSANTSRVTTIRKTPRHVTPVDSKVHLYDHKTRHRNVYNTPSGIVERLNIKNKPNADDLAREVTELESRELTMLASQQNNSQQRSKDAMLRDKIRRDYEALIKNLDLLTKEERRIKASQVASSTNQQIQAPSKKREDDAKRQKKMDRAFQTILRSSQKPNSYSSHTERPITITPRDYLHEPTPTTAWREQAPSDDQVNGENYSEDDDENHNAHKGMICDLLLKVEKLKKRLLQEYGAELPDSIFNASVKTLFNQSATSTSQIHNNCNGTKSKTPEIQVINMSGNEEACKSVRKFTAANNNNKNKKGRPPTPGKALPKTSTASTSTSTGTSGSANMRDQQVQVELMEKEKSKEQEEKPKHPIEPVVTVITPENADSNSSISSDNSSSTDVLIDVSKKGITVVPKESSRKISKEALATPATRSSRHSTAKTPMKISFEPANGNSSFQVGGLIIDAEKKEITVLTKKRKTPKSSARTGSPEDSERPHSLPGSRSGSPVAHLPKSAPSSRHTSPKKPQVQTTTPPQPPTKECPPPSQQKRYRTQITQVTIDSSTESSQMNSTSDASNGALYTRFTATSQTFSKLPDTSDASTTYRSPPAAVPGSLLHAIAGTTPILELLDLSSSDSLRRLARDVSPVSSPETPSPRTVLLPSNRPKPGMPIRRLKFNSLLADKQVKPSGGRGTGVVKAEKKSRMKEVPTRDMPASAFTPVQSSTIMTKTNSQTQTSRTCTCSDPGCGLFHDKVEDTQAYALKHWPEIVKKYEDLQNVCSERIVSLTDLIQKVRNEQKGLELSMVTTNEESKSNSASQVMPTSQSSSAGGNVSRLVKNIDSIHARLKRTLAESQKIISGEGLEGSTPYASFRDKSPGSSTDFSKEISSIESVEDYMEKSGKKSPLAGVAVVTFPSAKPKIIKDERVTLPLNRFRLGQDKRLSGGAVQTETNVDAPTKPVEDPAPSATDQSEVLVEMLSKEILEQSKSINKSVPPDSLKDSDDSILKTSQAHVTKDSAESNKNTNSNDDENQSGNLESSYSDYVPFLAGIPKIARPLTKGTSNGRTRPPVTLISGPYRPETMVSSVHELSTIVEFDTPDTANKSQVSTRSPSNKCRKKLISGGVNPSKSSSSKKDLIATKSKPSVQVAPLPAHRSPQFSQNIPNKSVNKSTEKSPKKSINKSLESLERRKTLLNEPKKTESSDSMHSLPDMHIEQLQQSHDNGDSNYEFRISQISELQSLPDENIDQMIISEICEESKSKTITPPQKLSIGQMIDRDALFTSTSSASFSGLSGVSEITTTPTSDLNAFKCPSSPEEMELALKKWGLGWAIPTLKKTREASALGSSSSSDVTPVNTVARLVSPAKKHHDCTPRDLPEISDVSSISIKHTNKSTEKSVLVRGRTSTPNRLIDISRNNSNNNSNNYSNNYSDNQSNNSDNRSNINSNNDSERSNHRSNNSNDHRNIPSSMHSNNSLNARSNDQLNAQQNVSSVNDQNIPSNDRSNIPLNVHSITPSNDRPNVSMNVHSITPPNDHPNIPTSAPSITSPNDRPNISMNVHSITPSNDRPSMPIDAHSITPSHKNPAIQSDIQPSVRSHSHSSNHSNVSQDPPNVSLSIPTNVPSSVHPNTSSAIPSSVHPNFLSNMPSNINLDVSSNVNSDIPSNIHSNIPSNVSPDVHQNILSNIPSNLLSNIPSNLLSNILSNIPSSVHPNILSNIPSNIPSYIPSNIPSYIPSNIPSTAQRRMSDTAQSNILSNVQPFIPSNIQSSISSDIHPNNSSVYPNLHSNEYPNMPSNSNDAYDYPNYRLSDRPSNQSNNRSNNANDYPNYRLSDRQNSQSNNRTYHSNDYPVYRLSDNPSNHSHNRSNNNSNNHSNYSSDGTISTLGSFSSDFNIVVPNQSSDMSIPNISFTNKLG